MLEEGFTQLPDVYKAEQLGMSVEKLRAYIHDPAFLRWTVKQMQDLAIRRLPEMLQTMFRQAIDEGKGRQQKMLLEFMKIAQKEEESKAPNIVMANNIPNPDQKESSQVLEVGESHGNRISTIQ